MQNGITTLENSLAVSYKAKYTLTRDLETPFLSIYPREMKTDSHKDLYMNVISSFIHNSQQLEIPQVSIFWWMDKNLLYLVQWNTTQQQKKLLINTTKWMNPKRVNAKGKKPDTKDYMRYDSIYMEF